MATPTRAPLGFALMARNAEQTLPLTLKSIRPYVSQIVVGVDDTTTDQTGRAARDAGADIVFPLHVSDWHECDFHGKVLAQDFAAARQATFAKLDPSLDFWGWIDADDVLEGAEHLPEILSKISENDIGLWAPYLYSYMMREDGSRAVNTLFHRERIFRTSMHGKPMVWTWQNRVHEVCKPAVDGPWARADNLMWVHQHQAHKTEQSAPRNLLLLQIEHEEKGDDPRVVFYMGNQYFAMGQWLESADWYERYTRLPEAGKNQYELWQSYLYMSHCYTKLSGITGDSGYIDAALQAAMGSLEAVPAHPEPYYKLSEIYAMTGEFEKCLFWSRLGDERIDAPMFAFKNPMDRTFNKFMPVADALMNMGRVTDAKEAWQAASQTFSDDRVRERIAYCESREAAMKEANLYMNLAAGGKLTEQALLDYYAGLEPGVKEFGRARNIACDILRRRRRALSQPKIIFWCGRALEPWGPPSLNTTGIGGSETAVVEIAKRFAKAGWLVDVYCGADWMEGEYDGVGYWDPERLPVGEECDVFVSWRLPAAHDMPIKARRRVLWCHDLNYGPDVTEAFYKWHAVLGVSQWHADMLRSYYGPQNITIDYVPNGIDLERFWTAAPEGDPLPGALTRHKKVPFQCVYASSPDRGLVKLLDIWPGIVAAEPAARLHIGYGWENMDKAIASGNGHLAAYKEAVLSRLEKLKETVVWRGRLPQNELANLYAESYLWLYPTDFLEVSCCVGDTLIDMPRDYTKYPSGVPIRELVGKAGFPVWSYNEATGRFQLSNVKWVARTGIQREIWKVQWDDGTCLRATPDHKVLTYKRGWVELQDLQPGESVVSLKKHAAVAVGVGGGPFQHEHRLVAEYLNGGPLPKGHHVDHIDGNSLNNNPENLQVLSPSEHAAKTFTGMQRTKISHAVATAKWREKFANDESFREAHVNRLRANGQAMWERVRGMDEEERAEWLERRRVARWNHKVVSVEPCGTEDVYDMEVEWTHNFVAGGVVIHNCISAMEAMAGGAVAVTSGCGALTETIGTSGFFIPAPTTSRSYGPLFQKVAIGALTSPQVRKTYAAAGRERAKELTWDKSFERWLGVLGLEETLGARRPPNVQAGDPKVRPAPQVSDRTLLVEHDPRTLPAEADPSTDMVAA